MGFRGSPPGSGLALHLHRSVAQSIGVASLNLGLLICEMEVSLHPTPMLLGPCWDEGSQVTRSIQQRAWLTPGQSPRQG